MADRFYQLCFKDGRPIFFEDMGNLIKISGMILQGMGKTIAVMSPNAYKWDNAIMEETPKIVWPNIEDWARILKETDDPKYFDETSDLPIKPVHRKQQMAISGFVQQKIFARDGFKCFVSGVKMGQEPLTVDHFIPLELGGVNDSSNYLTMSRKVNKRKGSRDPREWCAEIGLNYDAIIAYMRDTPMP